ncbi:hypothetical protein [Psychroserpens ponticola]|uniref:DUF4359 domain-containing protein n=1 Tax=Psychroserpens ponticola TaxID=2932268 RepID=A0ABY7S1Q6_9FLAO|nr:hypothetical protein [Psychroserpens ponticola]WCO03309.1 hypothetical protein MUN68_007355 [Psychroserpens ponticola]
MRSKNSMLMALLFLISFQVFSQTEAQIKYDKERFENRANELKEQLVSDIIKGLKVGEFEEHIVSLSIHSYFEEVTKIYMFDLPAFEKQDLITQFEIKHFNDLNTILDQEQIDYIINQLRGDWKKDQKKKKRKKKKKNK